MTSLAVKPLEVFLKIVNEFVEDKENFNPADYTPSQAACEWLSSAAIRVSNNEEMPPVPASLQRTIISDMDIIMEKIMKATLEHVTRGEIEHAHLHSEAQMLGMTLTTGIHMLLNFI